MARIRRTRRKAVESPPAPPDAAQTNLEGLPPILDEESKERRPLSERDLSAREIRVGHPAGVPAALTRANPVRQAMAKAFNVDPREVANFQPTEADTRVGEAIAAGLVHLPSITAHAGLPKEQVAAVINNPVAMVWISQRVEALFKYRAGLVDAALFMRAVGGDVTAIKLFFERHKLMSQDKNVNINYSGGVDLRGLPDDELKRIIADKVRTIPAEFRVISEPKKEAPDGSASGA